MANASVPSPTVQNVLFQPATTPIAADQRATVLELYKVYVDSMEKVVARRQTVHTFFMTVNSLLLTAAGLLLTKDFIRSWVSAAPILGASVAGILVSLVWMALGSGFVTLNKAKFDVIHALEGSLPARVFQAEDLALRNRKHGYMAAVEGIVPVVFLLAYMATLAVGGVFLAQVACSPAAGPPAH